MIDAQVTLQKVQQQDDDVWALGTIEGITDERGTPRVFTAHAWNSHLATLADDRARQVYLAQPILIEARDYLPKDRLPLAGPVALTLAQVHEALSTSRETEG